MVLRNVQTARKYVAEELNPRRTEHYRRLKEVTEEFFSLKKH